MATLSRPRIIIGLPYGYSQPLSFKTLWFLSNQINNMMILEFLPHLLLRLFLPLLLTFHLVKLVTKNQVSKKKKKGKEKKKKKPIKQGCNHASSSENPHTEPSKPKSPCIICSGNHFHRYFPCILWILGDWSPHLHRLVSSTSINHVESTPSTSENEVSGKKGRFIFPCRLC